MTEDYSEKKQHMENNKKSSMGKDEEIKDGESPEWKLYIPPTLSYCFLFFYTLN